MSSLYPYQRRRDPQPLSHGGELAIIALSAALLGACLAALLGLGTASLVAGGGWVWPHGTTTITHVLGGLADGHPGWGLPAAQAADVPGPIAVYACVAASELAFVTVAVTGTVLFARWHRPGDARAGMATRAEAAAVLGAGRLRAARAIIRPDLATDRDRPAAMRVDPAQQSYRLGRSRLPHGVELRVRHDRTLGAFGATGSGKTLDLLAPALMDHPGAALVTLTRPDDLLLTITRRRARDRPIAVLDPFGAAPGLPELVWDPIAGCVDPMIAERRAKAFAAGTVVVLVADGRNDNAARFYAAETSKVLQGFFHAAALTNRSVEHVLEWVANPVAAEQPTEILRQHPHAARFWDGLLHGALSGSPDTVGNTVTTVQQAMGLFFQPEIRRRCVPSPGRPATALAELIARHGTIYLLGREDPYASASPLMTAVAEHVLDTALRMAIASEWSKLCPALLACLDELPSTAPLPTLRVRMANERPLGITFLYATQTWRQLVVCYGEDEARSLIGLTHNLVIWGGGKDIAFYREMSELIGSTRVARRSLSDSPSGLSITSAAEDTPILRPEQLRQIPERHALVIAENAPPILARMRRCLDGRPGQRLAAELAAARADVATARTAAPDLTDLTRAAIDYARAHRLTPHVSLDKPDNASPRASSWS